MGFLVFILTLEIKIDSSFKIPDSAHCQIFSLELNSVELNHRLSLFYVCRQSHLPLLFVQSNPTCNNII